MLFHGSCAAYNGQTGHQRTSFVRTDRLLNLTRRANRPRLTQRDSGRTSLKPQPAAHWLADLPSRSRMIRRCSYRLREIIRIAVSKGPSLFCRRLRQCALNWCQRRGRRWNLRCLDGLLGRNGGNALHGVSIRPSDHSQRRQPRYQCDQREQEPSDRANFGADSRDLRVDPLAQGFDLLAMSFDLLALGFDLRTKFIAPGLKINSNFLPVQLQRFDDVLARLDPNSLSCAIRRGVVEPRSSERVANLFVVCNGCQPLRHRLFRINIRHLQQYSPSPFPVAMRTDPRIRNRRDSRNAFALRGAFRPDAPAGRFTFGAQETPREEWLPMDLGQVEGYPQWLPPRRREDPVRRTGHRLRLRGRQVARHPS